MPCMDAQSTTIQCDYQVSSIIKKKFINAILFFIYNFTAFCSYKSKKELPIVKREQNDDLLDDIKAERITEVTDLPPCKKIDVSRIPPTLPFQKNVNSTADVDKVSASFQIK